MKLWAILNSEKAAWAIGAAVVAALTVGAFSAFGWLGIGLIGVSGLIVTNRADLFGNAVPLYARQQDARSSPEQKMAAEAARQKKSKILYLINTFFIVLLVLGLGMFVRFQFPH